MRAQKRGMFSLKIVVFLLFLFSSISVIKAQHSDSLAQAALDSARWDSLQTVQALEQLRCVNIEAYLTACNFQPRVSSVGRSCTLDSLHGLALGNRQAHGDLKLQIHLLRSDLVEELELEIGRSSGRGNVYNRTISLAAGDLNSRSRLLEKRANVWEFQLDHISRPYPLYIRLRLKSASGEYSSVYSYELTD